MSLVENGKMEEGIEYVPAAVRVVATKSARTKKHHIALDRIQCR